MTVEESIKNAVSQGDIKGIRIMMKNSLLVDPTFAEFKEMENLTLNMNGLFDEHDEGEFIYDKSVWNDDYMNKLMVQVVGNFSHKRIDHLKEVVRYLRPVATRPEKTASFGTIGTRQTQTSPITHPRKFSYQEQKRQDERNGKIVYNRGAKITAGAVVGGVVGGTVAGITSVSILAGTITGAVVVGAIVAIATNGE